MPIWADNVMAVVQLVVNVAALIAGAWVWKAYIDKLKAALQLKDAEVAAVEKDRDLWRDRAATLEQQTPEVVEQALARRIQVRGDEIARLQADDELNRGKIAQLQREKQLLEHDLHRARGFRTMLELEAERSELEADTGGVQVVAAASAQPQIDVVQLGEVAVDSGQLMITDPTYLDTDWRAEPFTEVRAISRDEETEFAYSYSGACQATLTGAFGQLAFDEGHSGAGVAFATAWGDGSYPVYGELHDGRIVRVYINVG